MELRGGRVRPFNTTPRQHVWLHRQVGGDTGGQGAVVQAVYGWPFRAAGSKASMTCGRQTWVGGDSERAGRLNVSVWQGWGCMHGSMWGRSWLISRSVVEWVLCAVCMVLGDACMLHLSLHCISLYACVHVPLCGCGCACAHWVQWGPIPV